MTAHHIDTEAFLWLDRLEDAVKHRAYDCTCQVGGVDAMSIDTDWLRHALSELRRAHRNMSERVGVAEARATRAEAQSAIRGRAVAIYQQRAREAEAKLRAAEAFVEAVKTLVNEDDRRIIGEIVARKHAPEEQV